jgi:hypothetical protein
MRRINRDKRALSLVVSYVLLILVAFTVATLVYAWMKSQVGPTGDECDEGSSFNLKNISCDSANSVINLMIGNQGMFYIHGFVVKVSDNLNIMPLVNLSSSDPGVFQSIEGKNVLVSPLETSKEVMYNFSYLNVGLAGAPVRVSVQAIRNVTNEKNGKEKYLLCKNTMITQEVHC